MVLFVCALPAAGLSEERSPFEVPAKRTNPYNYKRAVETCTVRGIITTDRIGKAILQSGADEAYGVYSLGDKIVLKYGGMDHGFTITRIEKKTVCLKGRNGVSYEVKVR